MKNWLQFKHPRLALLLIGSILFLYIILRAIYISFTHDEALTVMLYGLQPTSYINQLSWTNNHLLNSWLVHFLFGIFGPSDFWLRLPNVVAGFLFLFFAARLMRRIFEDGRMIVLTFLLLVCNCFLIDFFGLARGYGLSIGLMMAGIYYFYRYLETNRALLFALPSFAMMGLALIANYTLLNYFLLQLVFFLAYEIRLLFINRKISGNLKKRIPVLLLVLTVLYFFLNWFIRKMLVLFTQGNFNFGGEDGFWRNTIGSLVEMSCGFWSASWDPFSIVMIWVAIFLFFIAGGIILFRFIKTKTSSSDWFSFFIFFMVAGCGTGAWLQHILMQVPFPTERTAIYFLVLFPILLFVTFFRIKNKTGFRFIPLLLLAFPFVTFLFSINITTTLLWPFNSKTKQAVEAIINDSKSNENSKRKTLVSVSALQYPVFNYYVYANNASWINFMDFDQTGFQKNSDYFLENEECPSATFSPATYTSIWHENVQCVYKRNAALTFHSIRSLPKMDFENEPDSTRGKPHTGKYSEVIGPRRQYSGTFRDTLRDSLTQGVIVHCTGYFFSDNRQTQTKLVVEIHRNGKTILWNAVNVAWFERDRKNWNFIDHSFVVENSLFPGDDLFCYFWNDGEENLAVDDFAVEYLEWESPKNK